jgi:magnesium transporter
MPTHTRALFLDEGKIRETSDHAEIQAALDRGETAWVDLGELLTEADRALLSGPLGLHPLVIEDIYNEYMQPKLEDFDAYRYLVLHSVRVEGTDVELGEIDVLIGRHWVLSHCTGRTPVADVWAECGRRKRLLEKGAPWLAHAIMDRIVDDYAPLTQQFETSLFDLEDHLLSEGPSQETLRRIFALKRVLLDVRRVSLIQSDIFGQLARRDTPIIPPELLPFFRDINDHFTQIRYMGDTYREFVANLFELHLSLQSQKLNEVMKVLTMFSTVLLPLTLIAGIYGMNFEHMPELKWMYGYPSALGLMGLITLMLLVYFRRKGWLGDIDKTPLPGEIRVSKLPPPPR